jgi:hypothetical protein
MKEILIRLLDLRYIETTKYSEIWQNEHYTLIWNLPQGYAKIRNRGPKKLMNEKKIQQF